MNFQELLQNKPLLYGIIAGGALILIIALFLIGGAIMKGGGNNTPDDGSGKKAHPEAAKVIKEDITLLTTDNLGKALEIQALLAKENIRVARVANGTKSDLI